MLPKEVIFMEFMYEIQRVVKHEFGYYNPLGNFDENSLKKP